MGTAEDKAAVYLFSNPLEAWGILVAIALFFALYCAAQRTAWYARGAQPLVDVLQTHFRGAAPALSLLLFGWLLNLLPYAAINRTTFAYHYMPALLYGNLFLAIFVDKFAGRAGAAVVAAATGLTWLYYAPWIYGLPLSLEQHAARRWLVRRGARGARAGKRWKRHEALTPPPPVP